MSSSAVYKEYLKIARLAVRSMKEPSAKIQKDLQRQAKRPESAKNAEPLAKGIYMRFLRQRANLPVPPVKL